LRISCLGDGENFKKSTARGRLTPGPIAGIVPGPRDFMRRTAILWAGLFLATAACGGGELGGSGGAGGGGGSPGSTSSASSGVGGGVGGESVTLTLDSFVVQPGEEVYKCQNFTNPFGGADAEVKAFASHMTPGSHHLLLFYKPGATDGPLQDCSGLEFAATPYSTQLPDDALVFPEGVAARISSGDGFRIQSHYLNTTLAPITAHVEITLHLAAPGTVTAHAGILFVVEPDIDVAPHASAVVSHDCAIPFDMNVIKAASHMHRHGKSFVATVAGDTVYETTTWDEPVPALFDPARTLHANDPLHFECVFQNDGDQPLKFGESADTDEMCIFASAFYPVPDGPVTVGCF
jgi:hypothetical protein